MGKLSMKISTTESTSVDSANVCAQIGQSKKWPPKGSNHACLGSEFSTFMTVILLWTCMS